MKNEKLNEKDFVVLAEYPTFYLCGKIQHDDLLYRECFMKVDVDNVRNRVQPRFKFG